MSEMMGISDKIRVTNIQRMCFNDGPGIRTTVFLKGCSLHCPWCANPENISFDIEAYNYGGEKGTYGRDYELEDLYNEIIKDKAFWGKDGGVTFSGGEPLMHVERLLPLLKKLNDENISIAVESSLFAPNESVRSACDYIDYCIADVKILDPEACKEQLGGQISTFLSNVRTAYNAGVLKQFRIPLCYELTYTDSNRKMILDFLADYRDIPVQIFTIHALGESKYRSLGMECFEHDDVTDEDLLSFQDELKAHGVLAEIIRV